MGRLSYASHAYSIIVINSQQLREMKFSIVGTTTYLFLSSIGKFNELINVGMERMTFFKMAVCLKKVSVTHFFNSFNLNLSKLKVN